MRALIVEDERMLAKYFRAVLESAGFAVDATSSGEEGIALAAVHDYDVILLDLGLPDLNGVEVVQRLRRAGREAPIVILTAQRDESNVIRALNAGADDYLTKPVSNEHLLARVRAAARRGGSKRTEQVAFGPLVLNRLTRTVLVGGQPMTLTPRELRLLEHFMLRPEEIISRTELLERVWDMHFEPGSNVVDVHIARLRKKLAALTSEVTIRSRRGQGFLLMRA